MIFEINKTSANEVVFREVNNMHDAWRLYELLESCNLHKNIYIGCFQDYEDSVIFAKEDFRPDTDFSN